MITSELITTSHQTRKALIYIRQSTPHQVLTNQESLRLQYALHQRALDWDGGLKILKLSMPTWA